MFFLREPEYDPHLNRNLPNPTSNLETMAHLLKGSIGSGILAMPQAFSRVGLIMGCIAITLIGIVLTHSLHILINSEYAACKKKKVPNITYPMTVTTLLAQGPKAFRPFARCIACSVDAFLVVFQLGICCIYMIFIGDNIKKLVDPIHTMALEYYMLLVLPPLVLLNLIPNLKALAPISAISNVITIAGVVLIMYMAIVNQKSSDKMTNFGTLSQYPLFFGTTMYALTSVGVVISAEANMKTPKDFVKPLGILNVCMAFVVLLYMAMGVIGYSYCVSECSDSITLDLPQGTLGDTVVVLYIIAILTSYALHCYVPVEIILRDYIMPGLERENASVTKRRVYEYGLRIGLCILTFLLAISIPRLGLFISLFGALCLPFLAMVYPVIMEICIYYPNNTILRVLKDIIIFILGLLGLVLGTYLSVYSIVKSFE